MFDHLKFGPSLASDNHSGVHPRVMEALAAANRGDAHAYGLDEVSALMDAEVARAFGPDAEAHLVFNGTGANVLALATLLGRADAVICAAPAHVNVDEGGAPEAVLGAKLYPIPSTDGRIHPDQLTELLARGGDQHFAPPRVVSLTQPTELGVTYSLEELARWAEFCKTKKLMLHVDGARFANAAAHLGCSLAELCRGVDVLSFGGTKNGLMGVELVVVFNAEAKRRIRPLRKRAMQLPSKTRFLAAQMYAYLKDDLWREIATHVTTEARFMAERLPSAVSLEHPVESNGLFVRLPPAQLKALRDDVFFYVWDRERSVARWMISWDWTRARTEAWLARLRMI